MAGTMTDADKSFAFFFVHFVSTELNGTSRNPSKLSFPHPVTPFILHRCPSLPKSHAPFIYLILSLSLLDCISLCLALKIRCRRYRT